MHVKSDQIVWLVGNWFLPEVHWNCIIEAGVSGHLKIGNNVKMGRKCVLKDINAGETVMGYPAVPLREFLKKDKKVWVKLN